ncbi:uncharacterized protein LOC125576696 [Brassica napus]|uniref:uncharacterized protein LOC125576696 n=1 Tax=Brassica napus TaxID=3708 RepID=UPI0020791A4A|nr:uncharacterized protein LOC125576696 [Brassica napus]
MDDFKRISGLEMNPAKSEIFFCGYADIEASVLSDLSGFKLGTFPTRHSLSGIFSVMDDFKRISGLEMNPAKSEIFFGGYVDIEASVLSDLSGFKLGTFPTSLLCKEYMYCHIGNGENAAFWFDNCTSIGPLLEFAGQGGPRAMRVRKGAKVIDATRQGSWFLPPARSDQIRMIQAEITTIQPPNASHGSDQFLWRKSDGTFGPVFCSKVTWEYLCIPSPTVYWHKVVWFKEYIPRNSFMAWLALLRRMPTRDRLRRWAFASQIWPNPPNDLHSAASWILQLSRQSNANAICLIKLIFQASIYLLWKEKNARIFTAVYTPPRIIHHVLDRLLRDRLLSIKALPPAQSPLQFYLSIYRPP